MRHDDATLPGWDRRLHTHDGTTHPVHQRGEGPGVLVVHEVPGPTPSVVAFAEEVVDAGFTVALPHLFGDLGRPPSGGYLARTVARVCVSRELTALGTGVTTPVAGWLRSLARDLHERVGGPAAAPGVGVVGMCFTGGFALATMVDEAVAAPVLCQPSAPFAIGRRRSADLNLSPGDLETVKARVSAGCPVLGVRYAEDPLVGTRFDTLRRELGEGFLAVELDGAGHSTVTEQRDQHAVDEVLGFLRSRLVLPSTA
ncbi:dienelactone hydrolase family protein [Nocardioides bruguierae]|uniref:dienelactone hydrolase family protein n=1 Tax=Nocardioides bruguierae TaxID=2945102 RepID=UPI0020206558|nr:dienelactone hydrolase family protein [Nocardioides bruguierae]MCL8024406.1 dienelactone hydrolase family protein [Nocardioides bruguierae]